MLLTRDVSRHKHGECKRSPERVQIKLREVIAAANPGPKDGRKGWILQVLISPPPGAAGAESVNLLRCDSGGAGLGGFLHALNVGTHGG